MSAPSEYTQAADAVSDRTTTAKEVADWLRDRAQSDPAESYPDHSLAGVAFLIESEFR